MAIGKGLSALDDFDAQPPDLVEKFDLRPQMIGDMALTEATCYRPDPLFFYVVEAHTGRLVPHLS